jgi:oligopeptide transport system substrate-binding protein
MLKKIAYLALTIILLCTAAGCSLTGTGLTAGSPVHGMVLNLYNIDPQTLDPAISSDGTSHQYITQIFSGLVALDDNLEPAPDIARDWTISNNGKTYTFNLRPDVKFQDGRNVTADDFKYSWERAADPATGSLTAGSYLGDINGVKEKLAGTGTDISGVRVTGTYTLEVTIKAPTNYFLAKMTYPTAFVVDKNNVESGPGWWHKPNGTGPFKLNAWTALNQLILEKNSLYYGEQARLDFVVFHLFGGNPMDLYEKSQIDVAGVSTPYIDRVSDTAGPFYKDLSITPELNFSYIGFNTGKPPFDDPDIRRAFSLAVDKNKLVSVMFRDLVQNANGILPPGIPGFNKDLTGTGYDINEAKRLISQSRYGSADRLPPITITTAGWGGSVSPYLSAIIYEWKQQLGIEVQVRQIEPDRYYYHLKDEVDEMFDMGWTADYPHPQDFLNILFQTGSDYNYGGYSNPDVDSLLARADAETDNQTSLKLYQQAEQKIVNDSAMIPLWFGRDYLLVKPYVKGFDLNPMGLVMLNRVTVEAH